MCDLRTTIALLMVLILLPCSGQRYAVAQEPLPKGTVTGSQVLAADLLAWFREGPRIWASREYGVEIRGTFDRYRLGDEIVPTHALSYTFSCQGDGLRYMYFWDGQILEFINKTLQPYTKTFYFDGASYRELEQTIVLRVFPKDPRPEFVMPVYFGYKYDCDKWVSDIVDRANSVDSETEAQNSVLVARFDNDRVLRFQPDWKHPGMYSKVTETRFGIRTSEVVVSDTTVVDGLSIAREASSTLFLSADPKTPWSSYCLHSHSGTAMNHPITGPAPSDVMVADERIGKAYRNLDPTFTPEPLKPVDSYTSAVVKCLVTAIGVGTLLLGAILSRRRLKTRACLLVCVLISVRCSRSQELSPSGIGVEPSTVVLGELGQQEKRKFSVDLYNNLDREVVFRNIRKSCGCMAAVNPPKLISAHGRAHVDLELDTGPNVGAWKQSLAFVYLNSESRQEFEGKFAIDVSIRRVIWTEPQSISVDGFQSQASDVQLQVITAASGTLDSIDVTLADRADMKVDCLTSLPLRVDKGAPSWLQFRLTGNSSGTFRIPMRCSVHVGDQLNFLIEANAIIRPSVRAEPSVVRVSKDQAGSVLLTRQSAGAVQSLQSLQITELPDGLSAKVLEADNDHAKLEVSVAQKDALFIHKLVHMTLTFSGGSLLRVPVMALE